MELVRHRAFSFAQESTRYCNYSKDKHNNQITYIKPSWMQIEEGKYEFQYPEIRDYSPILHNEKEVKGHTDYPYLYNLLTAERGYLYLLEASWQPQEARSVLPNSLKTELVMTGFISDWIGGVRNGEVWGFFPLRTAATAHPQMRELSIPLEIDFSNLGLFGPEGLR